MSFVAGIDFDSNAIHIALLAEDTDLAQYHRLALAGPGDAVKRIRRIRDAMPPRTWWPDHTLAVGIEEPFSRGKGGGYTMQLALGALLACLPVDHQVLLIRADDWRKTCGLPTRAGRDMHKANAKDHARKHWSDHPPVFDDNAADAFCIAYATRTLIQTRIAQAA